MSENPISLTNQLANRVKTFASNMGLTQKRIAKLIKLDEGHLSRFLDGKAGLSAEMTLKVVRLTGLSKRELDLKFGRPEKTTSKIMHLQEAGKPMRLDGGGWVPAEECRDDPNDMGGDITNTPKENGDPSDDELTDVLRQVDNFHRHAREAIANWFASQGKAHPNATGSTEPPRKIDDNTASRMPGPRPDRFSK